MKQANVLLAVGLAALTGCGGGGSGGYSAPSQTGTGNQPLAANFDSIQQNVFTPICTDCHVGASAPLGLRLDAVNSFGLLVGVPSVEVPELLRVDPGDPDASYVIQKLEGTAAVGERMPLGGPALSQADIGVIRQWISDGALAAVEPPTAPIGVTSLSPLPETTLDALPASIVAMFDRELDATSVDETTFVVTRSGGDGTFGDGNEVQIAPKEITVSLANPMTAVFDLTEVASENDTYRVRLVGSGPATIRDLDANALDGEFAGALPSGDGSEGGNFEAQFSVAPLIPTLDSIQKNVFATTCSLGCHSGPTGNVLPAGMDLSSADASFDSLVMVPSLENPTQFRVLPTDPDASYLIRKLEDTADVGARMPFGGPFLEQPTIDVVREWIASGANR